MIKRQVNDAQDAMGFRSAIAAGHSAYLMASLGGAFFDEKNPFGSRKRMPSLDAARRRRAEPGRQAPRATGHPPLGRRRLGPVTPPGSRTGGCRRGR